VHDKFNFDAQSKEYQGVWYVCIYFLVVNFVYFFKYFLMSILNKIYKTGSSIGHSLTYFIDMFMIPNLVLRKFMVSTFVNRDNIDFVSYLEIKINCKKITFYILIKQGFVIRAYVS